MAKRPPSLKLQTLALQHSSGIPLHRQLYLAIRDLILTGGLRVGERLPSSRALAKGLGISRNTVVSAYERLVEKNLTVATVGSGTRISATLPHAPDFGFLQHAFARHAAPTPASGTTSGFNVSALLRRSHYPLHRATFVDRDGNSVYLYNASVS